MAQTPIVVQRIAPAGAPASSGAVVTFAAADFANGNIFPNDGQTSLRVKNGDASAHTVTITSVPDASGRSGDIVFSIPAGAEFDSGFLSPALFNQQSGANIGQVLVSYNSGTSMTVAAVKYD